MAIPSGFVMNNAGLIHDILAKVEKISKINGDKVYIFCSEEMSELNKEFMKSLRGCDNYEDIKSEIVDVFVTLLECIFRYGITIDDISTQLYEIINRHFELKDNFERSFY